MANKRKPGPDRSYMILARDPETGKVAQMTKKAFDGVYSEKGFEQVDRDNVDDFAPDRRSRRTGGRNLGEDDGKESGQATGSAADIANKLNLGSGKNEKQSDNSGATGDARKSAGRNRGGS